MEKKSASEKHSLLLKVERRVFAHQRDFDETFHKAEPPVKPQGVLENIKARVKCSQCSRLSVQNFFKGFFPILVWLPKYSLKSQFLGDLVAGCTVGIMHIPQGMGYALLGNVPPIIGIYMAFFPVLIYLFLGTSHHISLGTFAVTTLMTGKLVDQYANNVTTISNDVNAVTESIDETSHFTSIEVATTVCLVVGLWQIIMGILRLGVVGIVLSDHLVSGFTTAAAIHVVVSQTKNLLGVQVPRFNGPFKVIRSIVAIFSALSTINGTEIAISILCITLLAVHNDWLRPWYQRIIKFPLPVELIVIVIGTVASRYGKLNQDFKVKILDHIPTGFPTPKVPPVELLSKIAVDSIAVAVVAYAISLSMAKIFARKRGYEVSNNQELLAQGISNVFGSFFSCMPVSASLSRSMIQESVGGETQLASLISCFIILIILLWIAPFFESLPLCILSSVIVVALKGMFVQVKDFASALKISPLDSVVWMVAFLSVVIIDIDIGLGIGVIASISVLIYRGHRPYAAVLGNLPGTEIHVDIALFPTAVELPGIKIFRWVGAIHFANAETFLQVVNKHMISSSVVQTLVPAASINASANDLLNSDESHLKYGTLPQCQSPDTICSNVSSVGPVIEFLIIDCSTLSYIDSTGAKALSSLYIDLVKDKITLILTGCHEPLINQLERGNFFLNFPKHLLFPTILDAVLSIQRTDQFPAEPFNSLELP